ncbi:MAG: hypothetical protein V7637_5038 [Mycobacteriales bacterium]|jgi:hypothetical protein
MRRLLAVLGSVVLAGIAGLIVVAVVVGIRLAMADARRTYAAQFDGWHHGTITLVDCFPNPTGAGEQWWECSGSFVSDDLSIRIGTLSAGFKGQPGPAATGYVADAETRNLLPPSLFAPNQSGTIAVVLGIAGAALGLPVVVLFCVAAGAVWTAGRPHP